MPGGPSPLTSVHTAPPLFPRHPIWKALPAALPMGHQLTSPLPRFLASGGLKESGRDARVETQGKELTAM